MRRALLLIVFAAVTVLSGCGGSSATEVSAPVTYTAHAFDGGAAVSTAQLRGKVVLLTSWASWCTVCRRELPAVQALYEARRGDGLEVVAVDVNAGGPNVFARRMVSATGLTTAIWSDPDNTFTARFGGLGVPTSVLLDRSGRVAHVWQGAIDPAAPATASVIADALRATT